MTTTTLQNLKKLYNQKRLLAVDNDFLEFEEECTSTEDLELIYKTCSTITKDPISLPNPHNSIILFLTGLTNEFDFVKGRSDTIDGSPPDVDIDFTALDRYKAIEWVIEHWGRENVAQIGTFGVFKPKGMTDIWGRINEQPRTYVAEIKKFIPDDHAGKAATLADVLEAHPDFPENYSDYYKVASRLEGMVSKEGIHAAGVVISDFPISDILPIRMKKDKTDKFNSKKIEKWITQFDMHEVENLGLLKFDFLGIENLDIIKEACRLITKLHDVVIDPYAIPDHDKRTYDLLEQGFVTGVFQMESSGSAKDLIQRIQPRSIEELSDISALNRPGPMQSGLTETYIDNKNNGYAPVDLPPQVAEVLKDSYWTITYQEQIMRLATDLAGFTLQESDDIRRAMGFLCT